MYRHTQVSWVALEFFGLVALISFVALISGQIWVDTPQLGWVYLGGLFISTLGGLMLYQLVVSVESETVHLSFGIGLAQFHISLEDVKEARPIRVHPYYTWGFYWGGNGLAYHVYGYRAVELRYEDGHTVGIGTDDLEGLLSALQQAAPHIKISSFQT